MSDAADATTISSDPTPPRAEERCEPVGEQCVHPETRGNGCANAMSLIDATLHWVSRVLEVFGMLSLVAASGILSYSVFSRHILKNATDWQDEASVLVLVGAVFLSGASVQRRRGHIGIEVLAGILPPGADRARRMLVDAAAAAFCIFFAEKSWALLRRCCAESWTSSSLWAPPMWIPYLLMAAGMTLLCAQLLLQIAAQIFAGERKSP